MLNIPSALRPFQQTHTGVEYPQGLSNPGEGSFEHECETANYPFLSQYHEYFFTQS
ncbi:hypothetical protein GUITHDRAFT_150669 [Guillardia theta CCMP2712]|uniref:Uncharacterized protein n=1 Tax=Guillardia theta (strain CCMP2712) TaxID=905079 RepID=L1JV42_GUITC|nr:hypothetical protein GUITHDRAFT_150669 [Guillardia theta CCMP2712]EKX52075.1 hypothetical protein GUITHDRAFT_150669 [Guillardia theta CCMP2712]|eukprot:XP_005839055.1 hypothetical protein GUITHDRAFT_150669 [Guillardia theta CCMP2712]